MTSVLDSYARQLGEYALRNYTAKVGGALADIEVTELTECLLTICRERAKDLGVKI